MSRTALSVLFIIIIYFLSTCSDVDKETYNQNRIQPYTENSTYWQYQCEPVLLVGTSSDDNLFQSDTLERELDSIASYGGNYLRCTLSGRVHFETGYYVWTQVQESGMLRPINCVKIYGGGEDVNSWGGDKQAGQERFWRNIFAGIAAVRFHRAPAGLGHSSLALRHVKSMRMLTDELEIFSCRPHNDLLSDRQENEAYCLADPGKAYAVVFLDGGQCGLDLSAMQERIRVRWLDILNSQWQPEIVSNQSDILNLTAPDNGFWAVLIEIGAEK